MTDEIRSALAPGPSHELLERLVGEWKVEGVSGRNRNPVSQVARIAEMFGGAWFEMRLLEDGELVRLAHIGYDGYRGSYAMWEIGRGFTSPQARAGESRDGGTELRFWRIYTIRVRDEPHVLAEELVLTFESDDRIRWRSAESSAESGERLQKDVTLTRLR